MIDTGPVETPSEQTSPLRSLVEWVVILAAAALLALGVRTFVLQAFSIPSESMETTLATGDHVVVDKVTYRFGDVDRGDIVVFHRPDGLPSQYEELIKRVIGLPGETVAGSGGGVVVDGVALVEPYVEPGTVIADFGPVTVPEGHVFMMGDNRNRSSDSRSFGPVPIDDVVGMARVRYWPLDRIGGL